MVQRTDSEYIGRRMLRMELLGEEVKTRFMDVVRKNLKIVGVREEGAKLWWL